MSSPIDVGIGLLSEWGLPDPGDSKKSRGRVMVVGGSHRSPGAVALAGEAALRVGAGRLGLLVSAPVQERLGAVVPEAAVFSLPDDPGDPLTGVVGDEIGEADAVLIGPGFDDPDETRATIIAVAARTRGVMILDAYALGVLPRIARDGLPDRLILNPNREEAGILLGAELTDDLADDVRAIARQYGAVVNCYGTIADDHDVWRIDGGGPGLATSGSGDVLAGAIAGFAARGVPPARAAVWGSWAHARSGDALTARTGIGFLARDLLPELTRAIFATAGRAPREVDEH